MTPCIGFLAQETLGTLLMEQSKFELGAALRALYGDLPSLPCEACALPMFRLLRRSQKGHGR